MTLSTAMESVWTSATLSFETHSLSTNFVITVRATPALAINQPHLTPPLCLVMMGSDPVMNDDEDLTASSHPL
jgi:hypothetical protein